MKLANLKLIFKILLFIFFNLPIILIANNLDKFLSTEIQIINNEIKSLDDIPHSLKQNSLYPYLVFEVIRLNLNLDSRNEVLNFYQSYSKSPLEKLLNYHWITYLDSQKKYDYILEDYKDNQSLRLKCLHVFAKLNTEPNLVTPEIIKDLWLTKGSHPSDCAKVYSIFLKKPSDQNQFYLNEELIQERINIARKDQDFKIISYLNTLLPKTSHYKKDNTLLLEVNAKPYILTRVAFDNLNPYHKKIILHGIKKLIKVNSKKALDTFKILDDRYNFTPKQIASVKNWVAVRMFQENNNFAENIFLSIPDEFKSKLLMSYAVKNSLKQHDWNEVQKRILMLPLEMQNKNIWQYWLAKTYIKKDPNNIKATEIFKKLSLKHNYYGFLAQESIKIPPKVKIFDIQKYSKEIKALETNNPGFKRAILLHDLNRNYLARKEWNSAIDELSEDQKNLAAMLAIKNHWEDRAIITLNDSNFLEKEINNLAFPIVNLEVIKKTSNLYQISPAIILGIARQESKFIHDSGSPKGAQGFMQIMPKTAKAIAKQISDDAPYDIGDLHTNIRYGTHYFTEMLKNYKNNIVLAAAAYNAGPTNVRKWLVKTPYIEPDIWIEQIPFKETRNYLKKVLTNIAVYNILLAENK